MNYPRPIDINFTYEIKPTPTCSLNNYKIIVKRNNIVFYIKTHENKRTIPCTRPGGAFTTRVYMCVYVCTCVCVRLYLRVCACVWLCLCLYCGHYHQYTQLNMQQLQYGTELPGYSRRKFD